MEAVDGDSDLLAATIAAIGVVLAALITLGGNLLLRRNSRRATLLQEIEVLKALPPTGDAHANLTEHVERSVIELIEREPAAGRRDLAGAALGVVFIIFGVIAALNTDGRPWLWAISFALIALGVFGGVGDSSTRT